MSNKYFLLLLGVMLCLGCSKDNSGPDLVSAGTNGLGGSLARFAIIGDYLYTVSNQDITVIDVSDANHPVKKKAYPLGFDIETIFPKGDKLFIGTETGMKIMDASNPEIPVPISNYSHIRSCDPVVANDNYAYVTLRSDNRCTRGTNELQVIDIKNLQNPLQVNSYPMIRPMGLAIDGNKLFVCDQGIKYYDIEGDKIILKKTYGGEAHDIILNNGLLMAIGSDGLTQYDYNTDELKFLSRIPVL